MANIKYFNALSSYQWIPDYLQPGDTNLIASRTATKFSWTDGNGISVTVTGAGFAYSNGAAVSGVASALTIKDSNGQTLFSLTGMTAELHNIYTYAFGFDRFGQNRQNPDGFAMLNYLTLGNDVVTGSNRGDDILGGRNHGNDTINALGGDDYVKIDAGNDRLDGGTGYDTLTLEETFWDDYAYKGAIINLVTKTVKDSWGGSDTFKNFEQFRGSKFSDTFVGDAKDNEFLGLRGNDKIAGGLGWDTIVYVNDERYGGDHGIIANLATGKVKDGFGNTDTVSGIEQITATRYNDTLIGNSKDNEFQAGAGNDTINGGGGFDTLNIEWWDNPTSGAIVDLRLATGQIVNDGRGGTDTIISIEQIDGTNLGDTMTGNDSRNRFRGDRGDDIISGQGGDDFIRGEGGADTLTGGAGADEFKYERRQGTLPWGDTITDFESGVDKITFNTLDFAGMGKVKHFNVGAAASGSGSWFYFNPADSTLYWDKDGTGAGAAVAVATLTGVSSISANDIDLFF